jgi:hypothetical protein
LAGLTSAANKVPRFTGSGTAEVIDVEYGTYTPTVSNTTNVDSLTVPAAWTYLRIGNLVHVAGTLTLDATADSDALFDLTTPIASNFTAITQAVGIIATSRSDAIGGGLIYASALNDTFRGQMSINITTATTLSIMIDYQIV